MKLIINNKIFEGRYNEKGELVIVLDNDFDILFFKKWQDKAMNKNGRLAYEKDYVEDIDFIKTTERGTLKSCFPVLSKDENLVAIHYDCYEIMDIDKRLFSCDICGQEKSGKKFPVFDENWNKQNGLNQCEDCFKEGCGID